VGDWIKIGTMDEGRVVDITWRTTRIRLRNQVMVSVPNSMASEAAIINYSLPDGIVEMWFTIHIDPNENPQRVVKVLMDALLSSEGVVKDPAPYARFNEFSDWSADYLFGYCFKDYTKKNPVRKAVWQNVWTHLHRAGIRPSFAKQEVFLNKGKMLELEDVRSPISVVEGIYIFNTFSPEEKVILSEKLKPMEFFEGQVIVKAGDDTNFSMYVIREGVVSVQAPLENGDFIEVAKLGAGNIFGEMSLLTGAVRTANILAASHTFIYEITKEDIAPLLEKHPEIYNNVKQVSNQRKENLQTKKQEAMYVPPPKQESLMTRLKRKIYGTLGLLKEIEELHAEEPPKEEKKA
ncbi:MAG TPA: mechanosensitive ion channel family protein, partial [Leptospiraceae bacterium]|nr:mechanosensitive ion channel family protein [Leptospiraceae bacterium]